MAMLNKQTTERPVSHEEMQALLEQQKVGYTRSWKPTTGGLLEIVSGYLNILTGFGVFAGLRMFGLSETILPLAETLGVLLMILGVISVIGGIYTLRRRMWGWSMAGAITALVPSLVIVPGTLALIFVTLGRHEFKTKS